MNEYSPHRWPALIVVLLAAFMDIVDTTIVLVALPSIQHSLHASGSMLQWTAAAYTLAFAVMLITGGRLGDIAGRKRIFLIGMAGFTAASALCGAAQDPAMLVGARVLQGAMAALMVPQVLTYIQVEFPDGERGKAMGLYALPFALGGMSGPLLGGILTDLDLFGWGWRTVFLVNVPVGLLGLVGAAVLMRESRAPKAPRLDLPGMAIMSAGLLALLYPLVQGQSLGWPAWTFWCMGASVPLFAAFVLFERSRRSPLIEMSLFRHRSVVAGLLVTLAFFVANGFSFVMTLHLQDGLGFSPMRTGLSFLPFSLGVVFGGGASMQLVPRLGRRIVILGALVMSAGVLVLLFAVQRYGLHLNPWQLAPGYLIAGFGMSMVATTLVTIVLSDVPPEHAGSASGLITTAMQVGLSASIAVVGALFFNRLGHHTGYVHATGASLWFVAGLFLLSFAFGFGLPRHARAAEPEPALPVGGQRVGHGHS